MSLLNEFSATLTQRRWREGAAGHRRMCDFGWWCGHEKESLSCQQCLARTGHSEPPISSAKVQPHNPWCQPPKPPTGVWTSGVPWENIGYAML